jgi:nitrite reductase/ring-hydroxylating ferredoxin subunit
VTVVSTGSTDGQGSTEGQWTRICRADSVAPEHPVGVELRGDDETGRVCVVRDGDDLRAMLDRCPHRDVRVSGGVVRDGLLTCPGHFWRFDLSDGHRTDEPAQVLSLYPTRVDEDGWVWAWLPDPPPRLSMREWLLQQARRGSA